MESFLYCWTDHTTKKLYVGVHKGSETDGYVCSSKIMLEQYERRSSDFTRQILAHGTHSEMIKLETAILSSVNAKEDSTFYNQHNGNGDFYCKGHTVESRMKIGRASLGNTNTKGRKQSEQSKRKISISLLNNNRAFGHKHTDEWKKQQSKRMEGVDLSYLHTPESIEKRRKKLIGKVPWNKGRSMSEEQKKKISESKKKAKQI